MKTKELRTSDADSYRRQRHSGKRAAHFHLIEHYLIPFGLAMLNLCVVHLIWLLATQGLSAVKTVSAVTLALILLNAGIFSKRKLLLGFSALFYLIVLLAGLI